MKRVAIGFVFAMAVGCAAGHLVGNGSGYPAGQWSGVTYQPGTQAAPSSSSSTGMWSITQGRSVHPIVECPNLGNVTAGSLNGYYCSPSAALQAPCMPLTTASNCTLPTGGPNALCPESTVAQPFGYIGWVTSGVTCGTDAGSGLVWDGGVAVIVEVSQG